MHREGLVRFRDGTELAFAFDTITSTPLPDLFDDLEDLSDHWRQQVGRICTCGHDEPVVLFADEFGGFMNPGDDDESEKRFVGSVEWEGRACRDCRAITTLGETPESASRHDTSAAFDHPPYVIS